MSTLFAPPKPKTAPVPEGIDLLTVNEVMAALKISRTNLYKQMRAGAFPKPLAFGGRKVRWRRATIEKFLREHETKEPSQ
jgi:prophage regulatory protein